MNPLLLVDYYKTEHFRMYPENMTKLYSNFTPRKSRIEGIDSVVVFGIQHFVKEYLIEKFNKNFFLKELVYNIANAGHTREEEETYLNKAKQRVIGEYKKHINVDTKHIEALWDLGYLPLEIKSLDEGSLCPIGVPMLTITNTHPDFAWLVNYVETLLSCVLWQPITSATLAYNFRKLLNDYAIKTTGTTEGVQWQGHDFSMRGMSSPESAILSGMGHLLSFTGTDTIPAIYQLESSYSGNGLIGASVPATEHSVMCMGEKESEVETFQKLLELYPTGILSVVSDTWDLWKVLTEYLSQLKEQILARDGKLVIRPDSGDPVDIICGTSTKDWSDISQYFPEGEVLDKYFWDYLQEDSQEDVAHGESGPEEYTGKYIVRSKYYEATIHNLSYNRYDKQYYYLEMWESPKITFKEITINPEMKGVIELLWDVFGGAVNEQGYKVLDSHIGAIYGDSINMGRAKQICERLIAKGFASTNIVFGIGSFTYQYVTRDTFGFAMKATYGEITHKHTSEDYGKSWVEAREIFKDPITDDGTKKSRKGLLSIHPTTDGESLYVEDHCTWQEEGYSMLTTVFKDGVLVKTTTLEEIRNRLTNQ